MRAQSVQNWLGKARLFGYNFKQRLKAMGSVLGGHAENRNLILQGYDDERSMQGNVQGIWCSHISYHGIQYVVMFEQ